MPVLPCYSIFIQLYDHLDYLHRLECGIAWWWASISVMAMGVVWLGFGWFYYWGGHHWGGLGYFVAWFLLFLFWGLALFRWLVMHRKQYIFQLAWWCFTVTLVNMTHATQPYKFPLILVSIPTPTPLVLPCTQRWSILNLP